MNAAAILERLKASGLHISSDGDNLRVGPREAVTAEALELIRAHKPELLKALSPDPFAGLKLLVERVYAKDSPEDRAEALAHAMKNPQAAWSCYVYLYGTATVQ